MLAERGYLIPAVNTETVDYVACAVELARSIKQWHPTASVSLLTLGDYHNTVFDSVIQLPYGDCGGFANDWQCFAASPYRQTIKLEADMIAASPIDHYWTMFELRDVVISQGCRTFYGQLASSRFYRKFQDENHLPDVYNAITYWRKSLTAQQFFNLVRDIFQHWEKIKFAYKCPEDTPTTDCVYAVAAQIIGVEQVTLPLGIGPSIVHMKKNIQGCHSNDWTQELVWERLNPGVRIQTVAQTGFFHYHKKTWIL